MNANESKADPRECVSFDDAVAMLPEGEDIHTFRSRGALLLGMDLERHDIIERLKLAASIELSGPTARSMDHGLAIRDEYGWLFIQTKKAT